MSIDKDTSLNDLFNIAKDTTKQLTLGEKFIVKDLFRGFEWYRIDIGNRVKLGAMFFDYAKSGGQNSLNILDKTPLNQQRYIKK